jgi:hypothetical protein
MQCGDCAAKITKRVNLAFKRKNAIFCLHGVILLLLFIFICNNYYTNLSVTANNIPYCASVDSLFIAFSLRYLCFFFIRAGATYSLLWHSQFAQTFKFAETETNIARSFSAFSANAAENGIEFPTTYVTFPGNYIFLLHNAMIIHDCKEPAPSGRSGLISDLHILLYCLDEASECPVFFTFVQVRHLMVLRLLLELHIAGIALFTQLAVCNCSKNCAI